MHADPLHVDADDLRALASEPVVRRGIAYFRENRVMNLGWEPGRLWASVDGTRAGFPYQVAIAAEDGELMVDCDCPFDQEPACKHAIAALLAYAASQQVDEVEVQGASDAAIEERARRGRTEVVVEHLSGDPWFGTWSAWSMGLKGRGRERRVQIRSLTERANLCGCPDFAVNLLGTCKHVEAVLHRLRKSDPARFARGERPPVPVLALAWDVPDAPRVRRIRPTGAGTDPLDALFGPDDLLGGELPEAWHALERAVLGRSDVLVGDDVVAWAQRRSEEDARAARARRIREEIAAHGGRIPGVHARLYPYQVEGVAFLAANGRALLADDMGLGKTLQAIAASAWLVARGEVGRVLVVTPASLKHQWEREIQRFTGLDVSVAGGSAQARLAAYRRRATFTVVNYELVTRDAEVLQRELGADLLVLDEAQRVKNWRTRAAAAVKALDTRHAFVLTGTPLENRLDDLYSLMQIVDPRVLGPLWRFQLDFHVSDERGKVLGYRNLAELRARLAPVVLRRDRGLVRDQLPDRIETRRDVPMDARQRDLHDGALHTAASIASIAKRRPLTPNEEQRLMAALQEARMACDAAGLVDKETVGSPKLDELGRLLEELCVDGGQKVVVFSQWERMTAMAEDVARALGLGTARLHGGVPVASRGALVDRFRDDPACQVFLSTDAGGTGLNLQCATALVNLDLPWNPAVLDQRIARIHRLGQREAVQVVLLVAESSYEGSVAGLIAGKRELFRNVVDPEATGDVVGLSKRTLELALEALAPASSAPPEEAPEPLAVAPEPTVAPEPSPEPPAPEPPPEDGASLAPLLTALQEALGPRIERIVAAGGGLLLVLDVVDDRAYEIAAQASREIAVAVVDARTYASLRRVGAAAGGAVYERPAAPPVNLARRRLDAAEALLAAGCGPEAAEMAVRAVLLALADRAGGLAPDPARAPLWLYGELVPRGLVSGEEAARIGRALALGAMPELPEAMAREVVEDAARVVAG